MGLSDHTGIGPRRAAIRGLVAKGARRLAASAGSRAVAIVLALSGLAGCSHGAGTLLIDPGHYSAYHCSDLAAEAKNLTTREKDLRDLILRADQGGGGGAIIGSLAYRSDYETVRSEERLLQTTAAEKNCNFTPQFQSDDVIR